MARAERVEIEPALIDGLFDEPLGPWTRFNPGNKYEYWERRRESNIAYPVQSIWYAPETRRRTESSVTDELGRVVTTTTSSIESLALPAHGAVMIWDRIEGRRKRGQEEPPSTYRHAKRLLHIQAGAGYSGNGPEVSPSAGEWGRHSLHSCIKVPDVLGTFVITAGVRSTDENRYFVADEEDAGRLMGILDNIALIRERVAAYYEAAEPVAQ